MRLAILADIHGNLPALEAVLADAEEQGVDGVVVAGDYWGGPQTGEVVQRLAALDRCWLVRGNRDEYIGSFDPGDPRWLGQQWAALRWSSRHLAREALEFLRALPAQRVVALDGAAPIRVLHGSLQSSTSSLYPDRCPAVLRLFVQAGLLAPGREPPTLEAALVGVREPVLVCGHTHIAWQQGWSGGLALNPGSVGEPLDGDPRARYALLAWHGGRWHAQQRIVPYDLARIRAAYRESGLLDEGGAFARACLLLALTGRNYSGRLIAHVQQVAAAEGLAESLALPDEVWEHAVATFDWPEDQAL